MAALGAILAVGQGIMTYAQGAQQAAALKSQANAEESNARIADRNRGVAGEQTAEEMVKLRQRRNLIAGQNASALGDSGIEQTSGLGLALMRANERTYQSDLEKADYNLQAKDLNLRQEVANRLQSAESLRSAAKTTKRMAILSGILTTASGLSGGLKGASSTGSTTGVTGEMTKANAISGVSLPYYKNYNLAWK